MSLEETADAVLKEQSSDEIGGKRYITAGNGQYHSIWTRDICLSIIILAENSQKTNVNDMFKPGAVKNTLKLLLKHSRVYRVDQDTFALEIPKVIDHGIDNETRNCCAVFARMMCCGCRPEPQHFTCGLWRPRFGGIDSNLLFLYAAKVAGLVLKPEQERGLFAHYVSYTRESKLIWQPPYSDFQDSSSAEGYSFFTNLLYMYVLEGYNMDNSADIEEKLPLFKRKDGLYRSFLGDDEHISLDGHCLPCMLDLVIMSHSDFRNY